MATEKRLIRYDGLKQEIIDFKKGLNPRNTDYATGYFSALSVVEGMMVQHIAEDAAEVVHGRWLKTNVEAGDPFDGNSVYCFDVFACSECGCHFDVSEAMNYCPNCGAKMDLKVEA